jgi:hypothetical protein
VRSDQWDHSVYFLPRHSSQREFSAMEIRRSMLAGAGLLALSCVSALAQQVTGVPGSPGATTTIDGTAGKSQLGFASPGLEISEQGLYHLPRDHAWHGGPTYFTDDFNEWHYFTFQGTDKKTGHAVTLFWCSFSQGWNRELARPFMFTLFAWHDHRSDRQVCIERI